MEYYANVPYDIDDRTDGDAQIVLTALWGDVEVSAAGIVRNAVKAISYEVRLSEQTVLAALEKLESLRQIAVDLSSGELLILGWLEHNYLFEGTISESPQSVLLAMDLIVSPVIKEYAQREANKLDVGYDAAVSANNPNRGDATFI